MVDASNEYIDRDLSGQNFASEDLREAVFERCCLIGTNFRSANLSDAIFTHCTAFSVDSGASADFSFANLKEAQFESCDLTACTFANMSAYDLSLVNCQLQGADLSGADFRLPIGAASEMAAFTMTDCNFAYGNLSNTYLKSCRLTNNRMIEAVFHNCALDEAELRGSDLCNISAQALSLIGADLRDTTFNNLNPKNIDLSGVRVGLEQAMQLLEALEIIVEVSDRGNR